MTAAHHGTSLDRILARAAEDFSDAADLLRCRAAASPDWPSELMAQARVLLARGRHDDVVTLVYLCAEIALTDPALADLALSLAEAAYRHDPGVDPFIIALCDVYHRRGDQVLAFLLARQHVADGSSDALVVKLCDYARDVGKGFLGEDLLRQFIARGRDTLLNRLSEHYLEGRNWIALRSLLGAAPADAMSDYLVYILGRANISLLLEQDVIACTDRLWLMGDPAPRYAQLLHDVWRWRIGEIEHSLPELDPVGLPFWLEMDARAIRQPPRFVLDQATIVRSTAGWRAIRPRENLPNVLGIGTQRSATTWLWYHLSQCPEVQPLAVKETVFFSDAFASPQDVDPGWSDREAEEGDVYWDGPTRNLFRYLRFFGAGFPVRADFSPSYAELPDDTVSVIRDLLGPDLRILLSVRDPADRAWSNLKYDAKLAGIEVRTLSFAERAAHYASDASLRRSDYAGMLERWSARFRTLKLVFFDDVVSRPAAVLEEVAAFLGLPPGSTSDLACKVNPSVEQDMPPEDRAFLLGLHDRTYRDAARVLGGPARDWRDRQLGHLAAAAPPPATGE